MKNTWLIAAFTLLSLSLNAQPVTLFSENFEGVGSAFTINTTDVSSVTDVTGYNKWIVNNYYAAGSGTMYCFGFPFNYNVAATAPQPGGIANAPNSYYMHILSDSAEFDGNNCASFLAADGFCNFPQNHFTRMTNDISTVGYINVNISFWWLCSGSANNYGELYYSTDGGASWILTTTPAKYNLQTTWLQNTVTLAAFNNQPTLRFGYRFVNNQTNTATDPSFGVDEVVVTGTLPGTITTGTVAPTIFCPGDPIAVPYTITGTYNAGNTFKIELSDAVGNFGGGNMIGSLATTAAGTVNGIIPIATPAGSGYRVRIISDNPAVTGSNNGVDLTVNALPNGGTATPVTDTVCSGGSTTINLSGYSGNIQWQISVTGGAYNNIVGQTAASLNTGTLTAARYYRAVVSNSCGTDTSNVVMIDIATPPVGGTLSVVPDSVCVGGTASLSLSGSTGTGSTWKSTDGIVYTMSGAAPPVTTSPLTVSTYYIVIMSSASCPDDTSNVVLVTVVPDAVAGFTHSSIGTTVNFTNTSTGATSYDWDFGDGNTSTSANPSHTYTNGNYTITLYAYNALGCVDSITDTVSLITSIENKFLSMDGNVYPNPSTGTFTLEFDNATPGLVTVDLLDINGRNLSRLYDQTTSSGRFREEFTLLKSVSNGIYFLEIKTPSGIARAKISKTN